VSSDDIARVSDSDNHSFLERAVGSVIGLVIYDEFRDEFREAEMRVRIMRHVAMAKAVKNKVEEVRSP